MGSLFPSASSILPLIHHRGLDFSPISRYKYLQLNHSAAFWASRRPKNARHTCLSAHHCISNNVSSLSRPLRGIPSWVFTGPPFPSSLLHFCTFTQEQFWVRNFNCVLVTPSLYLKPCLSTGGGRFLSSLSPLLSISIIPESLNSKVHGTF